MREAGGYVTDPEGLEITDLDNDVTLVAGNGNLHAPIRKIVLDALTRKA